ncbi:hypothetical protein GCM10029992_44650 [Glycomyces albus]
MIWLTWRQMRAQTLWTAGLLAAIAAYLLYIAYDLRESYRVNVTECTTGCAGAARVVADQFGGSIMLIELLILAAPALIGAFWGAPLITRELESGTHRLVWNQSVTRTRWLTAKLALVGGLSVAFTGDWDSC